MLLGHDKLLHGLKVLPVHGLLVAEGGQVEAGVEPLHPVGQQLQLVHVPFDVGLGQGLAELKAFGEGGGAEGGGEGGGAGGGS